MRVKKEESSLKRKKGKKEKKRERAGLLWSILNGRWILVSKEKKRKRKFTSIIGDSTRLTYKKKD